jgi:hypothetical protein
MRKILHKQNILHEGVPGYLTVTVQFVTRDELDASPAKPDWSDKNNSPKSIAELMSVSKRRSITYTDPISQSQHLIDFDALGVTDWENTYLTIQSNFDVGGSEKTSEAKKTYK